MSLQSNTIRGKNHADSSPTKSLNSLSQNLLPVQINSIAEAGKLFGQYREFYYIETPVAVPIIDAACEYLN
jgi:hypothetical protein